MVIQSILDNRNNTGITSKWEQLADIQKLDVKLAKCTIEICGVKLIPTSHRRYKIGLFVKGLTKLAYVISEQNWWICCMVLAAGKMDRFYQLYVIVNLYSLLLVSELMHCCKAEDCSDKGSLLVSYCLRMLSKCLTQLTQTSLYVVQIQLEFVLLWRLKLTLILW